MRSVSPIKSSWRAGSGRTPEGRIEDKFLVLYTIDDANIGVGDTVLQKLTFLSAVRMQEQRHKGFNYAYIKMDYGPYSSELTNDVTELERSNIITPFAHNVGSNGRYILENFSHIIEQNRLITEEIRAVNRRYAHIPRDELVAHVHQMKNPIRPNITIHETRDRSYILRRPQGWNRDKEFNISENDIASLEIYFNPKNLHALAKSLREAKSNPSVTLSEVLNDV